MRECFQQKYLVVYHKQIYFTQPIFKKQIKCIVIDDRLIELAAFGLQVSCFILQFIVARNLKYSLSKNC